MKELEYNFCFTNEERKKITAKMLQELRKTNGYLQKEVADMIKIKPATYNGYETGRNETPIEVLVRLSYLYNTPIDIIVQKERNYRTTEDLKNIINEYKDELEKVENEPNEKLEAIRDVMLQFLDQIKEMTDSEAVQSEIDDI